MINSKKTILFIGGVVALALTLISMFINYQYEYHVSLVSKISLVIVFVIYFLINKERK